MGIAIGAGTDIAIESADIVLMKSDLLDAVAAIELSRAVIRNVKMNLFWAFFYNTIGIPLAAGVFYPLLGWKLNPMFGAVAMSMSSVCVVLNALRLKFFKPGYKKHPEISQAALAESPDRDNNEYKSDLSEEGEETMKKVIVVEGMSCAHCQAAVEKALQAMDGVSQAKVDLNKKTATVLLDKPVDDAALMQAVNEAGYQAISVSEKKGIFG